MKMRHAAFVFLYLLIGLAVSASSHAEVEMTVARTLTLEETPLDTALSATGKYILVLTDKGKVLVYTLDGKLNDTIPVDKSIDSIRPAPPGAREEILFLVSSKKKTVQIAVLEFVQDINIAGAPFKGAADAPVTIVIFTDFQCPYCARIAPVLDQVFEKNRGKVKLVFKNFPLNSHQFARRAAAAALAAGKQGKFWEMHDRLFQNYNRLNEQVLQEQAQQLGLDMLKFEKDMNDPQITQVINQDLQDGAKAGVRGTPTIYVNGALLKNSNPEGFQAAIDKELEKKGKK
ncbi:MAG: oxidoreductase [Deltaproteobacteria bacterium]|jgi:protein-disulfide isomerase|nr:oxidoreductase [Deltaproteobacteria bacterium]